MAVRMDTESLTELDARFAALYEYTEAHADARRIWWTLFRHEAEAMTEQGARPPATLVKALEAAMRRERAALEHMQLIHRDLESETPHVLQA